MDEQRYDTDIVIAEDEAKRHVVVEAERVWNRHGVTTQRWFKTWAEVAELTGTGPRWNKIIGLPSIG